MSSVARQDVDIALEQECFHAQQFHCVTLPNPSISRHGRNTSAATLAEIAAIVWPAAEHDYQIARGRRARARVVDSAGNDYRRIERSTVAAE
jgi:hypothetical protein